MKIEGIFGILHNQRKNLLKHYLDTDIKSGEDNFAFELSTVYEALKHVTNYIEEIVKISENEIIKPEQFDKYTSLFGLIDASLFTTTFDHIKELQIELDKYWKKHLGDIYEIIRKEFGKDVFDKLEDADD